jgi:RNA polymerase sigma factor (sigma-70 family)
VGTDATPPPPPNGLPARLILGPALRAQSDRRLVRLVREGHESAFEEIVRRYRRPLDRFAASIVGVHADDVTQESFRKALVALRQAEADVDLRPWLFRIVRNTALTDLRDRPPAAAPLAEELVAGTRSAAAVAEQRAELRDLTARLRELPENQRTALVMRELEGMSHEEIAAALGVSGGAARQTIARARAAVRAGFGVLVPLPLLRLLATGDGTGAVAGATAGGGAAVAGGGAIGAGALKAAVATLVVAGAVGAGVAIEHGGGGGKSSKGAQVATLRPPSKGAVAIRPAPSAASAENDRNAHPTVEGHRAHRSGGGASEHHITDHRPGNGGPGPLVTSPAVQVEAGPPGQRSDGGGAPGTKSHTGGETGGGESGGGGPRQGGDGEGSHHGGDGSSSSLGEETRQGADGGGGGAESGSSRSGGGDGGSGDGIETEHETAAGESGGSDDSTPTLLSGDSERTGEGTGTSSTPDAEPQPSSPTPESGSTGGDGTTESTDGSGSS